jgi:5S rRNA maturation endonuclease (ribonuclease M5)
MMTATKPIALVLERLKAPVPRSDGYRAKCPAHDGESSDSLSIKEGDDGRVLIHCYGGCEVEEIVQALDLQTSDLFPPRNDPTFQPRQKKPKREVARYALRDVDGDLVAYHIRYEPKGFGWMQPDGKTYGLNGRKTRDLPLYGVDKLQPEGKGVIVVEGEKDAHALRSINVAAVATVTGAGNPVHYDEHLKPLLGYAKVFLWADNDDQGRSHMRDVAERLLSIGHPNVRMIEWPDAPPKGDAADFVESGGDKEAARALASASKPYSSDDVQIPHTLKFHTAREFAQHTPERPEWDAEGYVARGVVTDITGKIKSGKTTLTHDLCRAVLTGEDFLGKPTQQSRVVYLTEQAGTSFREALRRAGLLESDDLTILFKHDASALEWPEIVAEATQEAVRRGAGVLVVDTLTPWAGLRGDAENDSGAALAAMEPLQVAAAAHNLAVVVLRHDRKSGGEVGDSARGSSAFGGAVDIMISLRRGEGNTRETVRVLNCLSRFDETPETLTIEWTPTGYVALGSVAQVAHEEARQAVTDALPRSEDAALTEKDILAELEGVKRTTARQALRELVEDGTGQRVGAGRKGDPYRYFLSDVLKVGEPSERKTNNQSGTSQIHSDGRYGVPSERIKKTDPLSSQDSEGTNRIHSDETSPLIPSERNGASDNSRCIACGFGPLSSSNQSRLCGKCLVRSTEKDVR